MAALWASPSLRSPSPTSTSSSPDLDRSPQLPELSSPFNMSLVAPAPAWDEPSVTPTKVVGVQPTWMTDELDEEWIEQAEPEDEDEDEQEQQPPRPTSTSPTIGSSAYRPRVPSSLRYAFTSSTSSTVVPGAFSVSSSTSSAGGSIIARGSSDSAGDDVSASSIKIVKEPAAARDAVESQLQAAVRALQGPSAGLGAVDVDAGELDTPGAVRKARFVTQGDRLGGLRRLFDPPSPPTRECSRWRCLCAVLFVDPTLWTGSAARVGRRSSLRARVQLLPSIGPAHVVEVDPALLSDGLDPSRARSCRSLVRVWVPVRVAVRRDSNPTKSDSHVVCPTTNRLAERGTLLVVVLTQPPVDARARLVMRGDSSLSTPHLRV